MSFNPLMTLVTGALLPELGAGPTVIELGNQRFRPGDKALAAVTARLAGRPGVDGEELVRLAAASKEERLPMTEAFYRALGFADYKAIDVNDKFGSLMMDLNLDLAEHYGFRDQFSLVTNNGTGEHVFNQYAVFKNVHDLCRPGGLMLHIMPFELYVNHGFYAYQPGLYFDLAAANGYGLALIGFANRQGRGVIGRAPDASNGSPLTQQQVLLDQREIPLADMRGKPDFKGTTARGWLESAVKRLIGSSKDKQPTSPVLSKALWRTMSLNPSRKITVFAVLRKGPKEAPFRVPIQGLYSDDIASGEIQARYR